MSKYVLLKSESDLLLLKIPDEFCPKYEILQIADDVTLNEFILREQQVIPRLNFLVADCRGHCNEDIFARNKLILSLKQGDYYIVYKQKEILYVEACGSYSCITILNQKMITVTFNLADIESKLSGDLFIRIHRSAIVNINYITRFIGNTIYLGEKTFPVGRKFKRLLMVRLNLLCGSKKILAEEDQRE